MSRDPRINVVVTGDTKGLERALGKSSSAIGRIGETALGVFGGLAIANAVSKATDAVFNFANTGIDQFDALGDSAAILDANTKGLADTVQALDLTKLGFDDVETAKAAESISSAAEALGLTDKQAKSLVPKMTKLAAGYSALSGTEPAAAGELFAKALGGSAKAAKELGVEFTKGMSPAQRYQALLAKWGPLTEDAATGSRSLADEQATLDAKMSDLSTAFGGFLNDALAPVVAFIVDQLFPALTAFWAEHGPAIMAMLKTLGEVFGAVFGFIASEILPILARFVGILARVLGPVIKVIGDTLRDWMPVLTTIWGLIKKFVIPALEVWVGVLGKLFSAFVKVVGIIGGALAAAFRTVEGVIKNVSNAFRTVLDLIGDIANKVASLPIIKDFLGFVQGGGKAAGRAAQTMYGTTTAAAGSSRVAAGRASGGTVNINFNTPTDPVRAGREVQRVLNAYGFRGGLAARRA